MHYLTIFVSTRCQKLSNSFICHSTRLTEEEDGTKCMGVDIKNTDLKRDSGEVKGCNQGRHLCTACLDSLNHVIL